LLCHAFYQSLVSLKLDLIGKVGSRKNNKIIIRNIACHKKGNTYGNKLILCISLLQTCALLIILLIALINLVAVGGINTSLFNVSIMIMLPYLLTLREIMTFMMWNKLNNLLLGRVHSNLLICLKILMMHFINMRFMIYLNFALIITRKKNGYILKYFNRCSPPTEETNALQEPIEE
jgi:hypothetical protein